MHHFRYFVGCPFFLLLRLDPRPVTRPLASESGRQTTYENFSPLARLLEFAAGRCHARVLQNDHQARSASSSVQPLVTSPTSVASSVLAYLTGSPLRSASCPASRRSSPAQTHATP